MSTLRVGNLQNSSGTGTISVPTGNRISGVDVGSISYPGSFLQAKYVRTDVRAAYTSNPSGNGNTITDLNMQITPRSSTSLLIMQWMINGELHENNVFMLHKDGSLIATAGYAGYNLSVGNIRASGMMGGFYDQNEDSTPSNWYLQYAIISGSTNSMTFAPAIRSSSAGTYTLALNRTLNGSTGDSQESSVSSGMIMEVAQ